MIDALHVIGKKLAAEETMPHAQTAHNVHLSLNLVDCPTALRRIEEIDAQSWHHIAAVGMFSPVDGEGEEIVGTEIHHGEERVHDAFAQPTLCVLAHLVVGVPSA